MGFAKQMVQAAKANAGKVSIKRDGVTFAREVNADTAVRFMEADSSDATFKALAGLDLRTSWVSVTTDGDVKRHVGTVKAELPVKEAAKAKEAVKA